MKNITIGFCLLFLSATAAFAQSDLIGNLQQYGAANPQEKVYLHLDKPHYLTGDDIWLKGYVTLGVQNQFSALSKILYVDLVDPGNKVVNSLKLLILHGVAIGDMHLIDTLQEGTYHIRAYTNWMRNLPEETFFNKAFTIGRAQVDPAMVQSTFTYNEAVKQLKADIKFIGQNGFQAIKVPVQYTLTFADKTSATGNAITDNAGNVAINFNNDKNLELKTGVLTLKYVVNNIPTQKNIAVNVQQLDNKTSFMPEGGNMIAGLQSKVAFKMLQPDGYGASGNGYVTDESGEKLIEFASGYAGMGSFFLTPQAGKNYKAVITYANGKSQTTALPAALAEGYNLSVVPRPAYALLAITVSPALIKNQKVTLLVQRQGKIIYTGQKTISSGDALTRLPMDNLPSGIIQVTLFDENMKPVCERLFFNLNQHTAMPLAATVNNSYQTRQPVTVTIKAGAATDSLRTGSFSASVVNLAGIPPLKTNETGILPGLLLTPELKGYVERPDHYFEVFDNNTVTDLDNLVLCQGWRRIVWDDVKAAKLPAVNYQPEKAFAVTGTVTQKNGTPAAKAKVSLLATKSFMAIDTVTDASGHYIFDNLLLKDNNRFALRAKDADGKHTLVLKVDRRTELPGLVPNSNIQFPDDLPYQAFLKTQYAQLPDSVKQHLAGYRTLKEVNIVSVLDKKKQVPAFSANLNGPGNADQVFLADEMKYSMTLKQFLNGRAMGLKFIDDTPYTTRGDNFALPGGQNPTQPMRVILDGTEVPYAESGDDPPTNWIPVEDVASIEILRTTATTAVYGQNNGIIIITTKTGKVEPHDSKASPEFVPLWINGYNTIREFYAPDYSVAKTTKADHRTTVYWKPDIVTDKEGNAKFTFYTTDDKGTYQLSIEGMTADGRPAHLVQSIKVE